MNSTSTAPIIVTLRDKQSQFEVQQKSVGLSEQLFGEKFVFNSNSGPDAVFLSLFQPSPSQLIGLSLTQQNLSRFLMAEMLFKAGEMLKLPVSTTIVSISIAQYYFTRKSLLENDFRDIAMGAMFLACKSEETLRRSYQIAAVFDYIFKMYEGIRCIRQLQLNSPQYNYMKEKVIKCENQILFELGFEVYKLFDIPHRYISGLLSSFNKHKDCNTIVQHSWTFLNDIYRTKAVVCYPGQIIAAASVFMTLHKLNIPMPEKPWWILIEASLSQIKQICILTNQMYKLSNQNKININIVSQALQGVGKQRLKISNVFPVPYSRKIRLENQGLLKKNLEPQIRHQIADKKQQQRAQDENDKEEEQKYRQKSKKQKKKDKKKHKSKNYDGRNKSKSHSEEENLNNKKGIYQNDDQTPKIRKLQNSNLSDLAQPNNNNILQGFQNHEEIPSRKASEISINNGSKQPIAAIKKSILLDAKSMLSKISLQIKKIEVKNEMNVASNQKVEEPSKISGEEAKVSQKSYVSELQRQEQKKFALNEESESDSEDELMAQLIEIKKKNMQKKEQGQV